MIIMEIEPLDPLECVRHVAYLDIRKEIRDNNSNEAIAMRRINVIQRVI